jgi:hypothetical protein
MAEPILERTLEGEGQFGDRPGRTIIAPARRRFVSRAIEGARVVGHAGKVAGEGATGIGELMDVAHVWAADTRLERGRGRSAAVPAIQRFNQVAKCTNHTSSVRSSDPAAARQPGGEAVHEKSLGSLEQPGYP